tara:strand:- start:58550 stop:59335 length:786 start_codon:yes stop_codon:yes gene_type:complete
MEDEATKHFDSLPDEKKHLIGTFCILMCKLICRSSLKCFKKNICHSSNDEIYNINQLNNCHEYSRTCGLMDKHITNLCKSKEVIDAILRIYEKDEYYQILPPPIYKRFSVFCKPDTNDDKDTKETLLLLSNVIILMNFIKKVLTNKSDEKIKLFNVENKLRTLFRNNSLLQPFECKLFYDNPNNIKLYRFTTDPEKDERNYNKTIYNFPFKNYRDFIFTQNQIGEMFFSFAKINTDDDVNYSEKKEYLQKVYNMFNELKSS